MYTSLLKDGESWHPHTRRTLMEIEDCVNIMRVANRLPDCFWEDIQSIHATNFTSLYGITKRMIEEKHPEVVCKCKPNLSFLIFVIENLKQVVIKN